MALALVNRYTVLERDNVDDIAEMTGLSVVELNKQRRECETFFFTRVFWTTGEGHWYSVRFDDELVEKFGLEQLMYEAFLRADLW